MSESILRRVASSESAAVDEILQRYGGLIWSLARRFCRDAAEAEDAVQEILLEVWKSAHRYSEEVASEATFITMIARRRLIDRSRRRSRRIDPEPLPDQVPSPDRTGKAAEIADEAARARRALDQLRPEQKKVLELSIYSGLSHEGISKTTGLPLGTVKTHARRGLIRVRELLGSAPREEVPAGTKRASS